jgi:hypothetical protein
MAENQYTQIQQTDEAEITFHDTIQRRGSSRWLYVLISKYRTGTDRLYCSRKDCLGLTQPYNARYAAKYRFFARFLTPIGAQTSLIY